MSRRNHAFFIRSSAIFNYCDSLDLIPGRKLRSQSYIIIIIRTISVGQNSIFFSQSIYAALTYAQKKILPTLCILFAVPHLHKCERNQKLPDLEKCVARSIESMQRYFQTGYGMNIPQFEPHYQPENFQFSQNNSIFAGNLSLYDVKIQGLTQYKIDNVR